MNEELKKIRNHIERNVTHIAREHGVSDEVVWKQMLIAAVDYSYRNKDEVYFKP